MEENTQEKDIQQQKETKEKNQKTQVLTGANFRSCKISSK